MTDFAFWCFSTVARFASVRTLAMNWPNLSCADRQFCLGARPQTPCYFEGGKSPLQNQNLNSTLRHLFADLRMMLHMVFTYHCVDSFVQVEYYVIYELHSRNRSIAICATLKLRIIQHFVALQASRQFLLKQHLRFNSSNSLYVSRVVRKSLYSCVRCNAKNRSFMPNKRIILLRCSKKLFTCSEWR